MLSLPRKTSFLWWPPPHYYVWHSYFQWRCVKVTWYTRYLKSYWPCLHSELCLKTLCWRNSMISFIYAKSIRDPISIKQLLVTQIIYNLNQILISVIVKWTEVRQMGLNIGKCVILTCGRLLSPAYTVNSLPLTCVSQHPYLGIMQVCDLLLT